MNGINFDHPDDEIVMGGDIIPASAYEPLVINDEPKPEERSDEQISDVVRCQADLPDILRQRPEKIIITDSQAMMIDRDSLRRAEAILQYVEKNLHEFGLASITKYRDLEKQEIVIRLDYADISA